MNAFSMGSDPRLYNENVFVARPDHTGDRTGELSRRSLEIGNLVVEEEFEVRL
jgi:hypothetical protein